MMGVTKPVIKAHGSSNAKAFKNAVRQAKLCVESGAVESMREKLGRRGPDRGSRGVTAAGKARGELSQNSPGGTAAIRNKGRIWNDARDTRAGRGSSSSF